MQNPGDAAQAALNYDKVMDVYWNKLQLAKVSRKHGLPYLAQQYLNQVKRPLLLSKNNSQNVG